MNSHFRSSHSQVQEGTVVKKVQLHVCAGHLSYGVAQTCVPSFAQTMRTWLIMYVPYSFTRIPLSWSALCLGKGERAQSGCREMSPDR